MSGFDVSELDDLAARFRAAADATPDRVRQFVTDTGEQIRQRMRDEVPVDSGETRDSIQSVVADDGTAVEVGPTNRDDKGRPIGHFIEYGARGIPPDPFVLRTATWASPHVTEEAHRMLEGLL